MDRLNCFFPSCKESAKLVCLCTYKGGTFTCETHKKLHEEQHHDKFHKYTPLNFQPNEIVQSDVVDYFRKHIQSLSLLESSILEWRENEIRQINQDSEIILRLIRSVLDDHQKFEEELRSIRNIPVIGTTSAQSLLSVRHDELWLFVEENKRAKNIPSVDQVFELTNFFVLKYVHRPINKIIDGMSRLNDNIKIGNSDYNKQRMIDKLNSEIKKIKAFIDKLVKDAKEMNHISTKLNDPIEKVSGLTEKS